MCFPQRQNSLLVCSRQFLLLSVNHEQIVLMSHHAHYEKHYWISQTWVVVWGVACSHRAQNFWGLGDGLVLLTAIKSSNYNIILPPSCLKTESCV